MLKERAHEQLDIFRTAKTRVRVWPILSTICQSVKHAGPVFLCHPECVTVYYVYALEQSCTD